MKQTRLLSGHGHLKSTWNGHFFCCQPVLNGHLDTTQHARHRKCERLPQIFRFLHLKPWLDELIWLVLPYCIVFLFRFVCIELVPLIWFLQIWVAIYVYGTMINWFTLIKKWMQTYIVIVSGSILNVSTVHLNGIWHLIWRYLLKPALGRHPVLSRHYSIPRGCLLNTGFTVMYFANNSTNMSIFVLLNLVWLELLSASESIQAV